MSFYISKRREPIYHCWVLLTCPTDQTRDPPVHRTLLSDSSVSDNDDDEKRRDRKRD